MVVSAVGLVLLLFAVAETIKVVPKVDFGNNSPGINPEQKIIFTEKDATVKPGVVKAVLEVSLVTDKNPSKSDKKKTSKKNKILICNTDGNCKYHEIKASDDDEDDKDDDDYDDDEEGKKKELKPIIVTDFDKDPLESNDDDDYDYNKKHGKKIPKVPVVVGYKGAVTDDDFHYPGGKHFGVDRIPAYYGMKLSPGFHQPYPGPVLFDETSHRPPHSSFEHGSYYYQGVSYAYPPFSDHSSVYDYPDYTGGIPFDHSSFPGHASPRTPTPYGKYYPTNRPGTYPGISSYPRRNWGTSGWSTTAADRPGLVGTGWSTTGADKPGVYWPSSTGSSRPGVYWPMEKPSGDPSAPPVIAVHGKMDFDEDELSSGPTGPTGSLDPTTGSGVIKIDGKLGDPLKNTKS